jgi:hypothetical protein
MKAVEIARQLNRDASVVSRLCATYEAVRDLTFNPFRKAQTGFRPDLRFALPTD